MIPEEELERRIRPLFKRALAQSAIYLANHSLGRPPDRMAEDVARALDAWYRDQGEAWDEWLAAREKFRTLTARLVGSPRADCIIPKTSAGQGLRAVLNALEGKPRVVTTDGEFDSIDLILRVYRQKGRIDLRIEPWTELQTAGADLVVVSSVMFRTGEVVKNLAKLIRAAHEAGALVLVDAYHHAGVMPLDLASLDADFAVGGSYKYTRGGPGACWLYVRPGLAETLRTLDTGWFAKKDAFAYERPEPPDFAPGGDAWLESTPPVLACVQALAGLEFTLEVGVQRLRAHHLAQKARFAELLREQGIEPEGEGPKYGQFLTFVHPEAARLSQALLREGIKVDARGDRLRLCADLLNTEEELKTAARALGRLRR